MDLSGRSALVTGGGRGIGRAIAAALAGAGAEVTVWGRDPAPLQDAVGQGHATRFRVADVTDPAVWQGVAAPDILVNNAGAAETAPIARLDRALWDRMLLLNLTAVYEACHALLPGMMRRGSGRVVTIASTAGLTGYAYSAAYSAAKAGVVGLTRALAREAAASGVTVNAVCPGFTDTDLVDRSAALVAGRTGRDAAAIKADYTKSNPQGRLVRPAEVAAAVLFLCGPDAGSMTGQAIVVAGGEV